MKKYLVDIYLAYNLGDDMFLDFLVTSFPEHQFIPFYPGNRYEKFFSRYPNITKFPYTFIDKILFRIGIRSKLEDYEKMADKYDGLIFLGGGIFRQEDYWKSLINYRNNITDAFLAKDKSVQFLGCNFGPYLTIDFKSSYLSLFKKCEIVSFRDLKSYYLFNDLNTIKYAPDLLWSYNLPVAQLQEKTIGISIINPKHKFGLENHFEEYINIHQTIIQEYLAGGFQIKLFSFCESEGDLEVCKEIAAVAPNFISIYNYNGHIKEYLLQLGSCSKIIAARFHGVIIALKYEIPVLPIIYSEKTRNLLSDLNFMNSSIEFDNLQAIKKGIDDKYIQPDISVYIENSLNHLKLI